MDLNAWKILMEGSVIDGVDNHTIGDAWGGGQAVELETGLFLYSLVRRLNPTTCLETGTHWGFSAACIALALKDQHKDYPHKPHPMLYTCDPAAYDQKAEALWDKIGVSDYVYHHIGESYTWEPPCPNNVRFCWYDGDHSAKAILTEFRHFAPYYDPKRIVIGAHDVRLDRRMPTGLKQILDEIHLYPYKHIAHLALRNYRGADFIQMTNEPLFDGIPD